MDYTVVEKDVEYIPRFDGNQERDEDEQIVFVLKYLTNAQRSKCYRISVDANGQEVVEPNYELLIKYGVDEIRGFSINGNAITNARAFSAVKGFDALYMEIATQVLIMNARQDSKN